MTLKSFSQIFERTLVVLKKKGGWCVLGHVPTQSKNVSFVKDKFLTSLFTPESVFQKSPHPCACQEEVST